jgi:hypothetical protein
MRTHTLTLAVLAATIVVQAQEPKVITMETVQKLRDAEQGKWADLAEATGIPYTQAHRAFDEQLWQTEQLRVESGYPTRVILMEWYVQLRQTRESWLSAYLGASDTRGLRARLSPEALDKYLSWKEWMETAKGAFSSYTGQ